MPDESRDTAPADPETDAGTAPDEPEKATVAATLRTPTLSADDAERVTQRLAAKLDRRLARWDADRVEMEYTVKDRDSVQQKVTLEAWIAVTGRTHFVATSNEADLDAATDDVATDLQRQVGKFVDRRLASHR